MQFVTGSYTGDGNDDDTALVQAALPGHSKAADTLRGIGGFNND